MMMFEEPTITVIRFSVTDILNASSGDWEGPLDQPVNQAAIPYDAN